MKKMLFIMNPCSGTKKANKYLTEILSRLANLGVITTFDYTVVPSYIKGEIKVYLNLMTCYMVKAIQLCSTINVEFDEEG